MAVWRVEQGCSVILYANCKWFQLGISGRHQGVQTKTVATVGGCTEGYRREDCVQLMVKLRTCPLASSRVVACPRGIAVHLRPNGSIKTTLCHRKCSGGIWPREAEGWREWLRRRSLMCVARLDGKISQSPHCHPSHSTQSVSRTWWVDHGDKGWMTQRFYDARTPQTTGEAGYLYERAVN